MVTTGYSDTFNRTVANGLGAATSGQAYTLGGVATQFSVTPSVASIAIASAGDKLGYVDLQTGSIDITGQVALNAIPATNLATVGFVAKLATVSNYYSGTMMVATGGAISLRFSKVISSSLITIATVATGLTYVANTFYNLRYSIVWSRALQTNVMTLKLWAVGATEPGGWTASTTDAAITDYTTGTQFGLYARDESTTVGTITAKFQSFVTRSYGLPMPATTDAMCADPAVAYPKQTALQSLAVAADTAMASLDPRVSLAGLFPRVRISNTNYPINTAVSQKLIYNATEYNIGTNTNLGYDNTSLYLPIGVWLLTFEIQLSESATNQILLSLGGTGPLTGQPFVDIRSNPLQANDQGIGGTGHVSALTYSTDPTVPIQVLAGFSAVNNATTYPVKYMALSATKISDYFA